MKYQKLGKTDLEASVVSFGTWGIGGGSVWSDKNVSLKDVEELLDLASDLGINYIDTAPVYGTGVSEKLLGEALHNGRRNEFLLQTKCSLNWRNEGGNFHYERDGYTVNNDTSYQAIMKDVEDSLERLRTDYIDLLVVHYVCKTWPVEETMQALNTLLKQGKVRALALSNSKPSDLDEYEQYGNIAVVQEQYSLLAPNHGNSYFETCKRHGTTFQVYGALEEGFLTERHYVDREFPKGDVRGKLPWIHEPIKSAIHSLFDVLEPIAQQHHCSVSNIIQAYTLVQYDNINLLTGFTQKQTMIDTCKCLDVCLSKEEIDMIRQASIPATVEEIDK